MPRGAKALIATVVAGGVAAVASVFAAFPPVFDSDVRLRAITLMLLTTAAELIAIRLAHGSESELITLTEVALVADIVLLPPSVAVSVALSGLLIALIIQRRAPVKTIFNLGQYALGTVIAVSVYHQLGGGHFDSSRGLAALALGVTAFTAVNFVTISAILAATQGRRFAAVLAEERGLSLAIGVGCSSIGIVAVAAHLSRPELLPFVLAPTVAVHLAFRGWVKQKELTTKMSEETSKLQRIIEHSSEGIVLAGGDGDVILWSPSMERMTGISSSEAIGKRLAFLLRGRGLRGEAVAVEPSEEASTFEFELMTPGGDVRWLRLQHGPAFSPKGALVCDVLVVNDVTRAREVERLKGDFIATVSHELRTPLTPIKGFASLLLKRGDELSAERRREALATIIDRTDQLARLVEDLLLASSMSRDGERRLPDVQRQPVDLTTLLDRVVRPFRRTNPHREFVLNLPAGPSLAVYTDALRAEQMIAHLVANAVKFSEEATPVTLTVSNDGDRARIDVRDEGRGIPADKLDVIFDRFKRLEDPLRMETGGAGLGLFIAGQLAAAMDAMISVKSSLGEGSTFTVTMPVVARGARGTVHPLAG